jgi:hypothetical protein
MSLDGNWNQIISNKLVTRNKEDPLSRSRPSDTLPTPSTDHRGIEKDCLLREDICTDEYRCVYTSTQEQRFFITISNNHTRWADASTTLLFHQCTRPGRLTSNSHPINTFWVGGFVTIVVHLDGKSAWNTCSCMLTRESVSITCQNVSLRIRL